MRNYDYCFNRAPKAKLPTKADIVITCIVSLLAVALVVFPEVFK